MAKGPTARERKRLVGIAGETFTVGTPPSDAVSEAIVAAAAAAKREALRLAAVLGGPSAPGPVSASVPVR